MNLKWFVLFKVHQQLFGDANTINAFRDGLLSLGVEAYAALQKLQGHELTLRIEGQRHITGEMLWRTMAVHGSQGQETTWLHRIVLSLNEDQMLLLLRFATSHIRLMLDGLPRANAGRGRQIIVRFGPHQGLPRAHTCSYEIDMPHYGSEDELRDRLITALSSDMAMGLG